MAVPWLAICGRPCDANRTLQPPKSPPGGPEALCTPNRGRERPTPGRENRPRWSSKEAGPLAGRGQGARAGPRRVKRRSRQSMRGPPAKCRLPATLWAKRANPLSRLLARLLARRLFKRLREPLPLDARSRLSRPETEAKGPGGGRRGSAAGSPGPRCVLRAAAPRPQVGHRSRGTPLRCR